jgi:hypothetical protein
MVDNRTFFKIFLASPGDLEEERKVAQRVAQDLSDAMGASEQICVEILNWERVPPGGDRPQDRINRLVDQCDLFLGLLGNRWGQETGIPEYTSGFQEEWERAKARRSKSGQPEIWLMLRKIDDGHLSDPGPQLRKVMQFRKRLVKKKECFFREFVNPEDLERQLRNYLTKYLLSFSRQVRPEPSQATTSPRSASEGDAPGAMVTESMAGIADSDPVRQIAESLQAVALKAAGKIAETSAEAEYPPMFHDARSLLHIYSRLSDEYTHDVLGNHEVNLLYRTREKLNLAFGEMKLLLRTTISNEFAPGWYWLRDRPEQVIEGFVCYLAAKDKSELVRGKAMSLLRRGRVSLQSKFTKETELLHQFLTDDSKYIRNEGLEYAQELGGPEILKLLKEMGSHGDLFSQEEFNVAMAKILIRNDPSEAVQYVISTFEKMPKELSGDLSTFLSSVNDEQLLGFVNHQTETFAAFAITELIRRGKASIDYCREKAKNGPYEVRVIAFQEMIRQGVAPNPGEIREGLDRSGFLGRFGEDRRETLLQLFRTYPAKALESEIDSLSVDAPIAYQVMAEIHFDAFGDRLRSDLDSTFESYRGAYLRKTVRELIDHFDETSAFTAKDRPRIPKEMITEEIVTEVVKEQFGEKRMEELDKYMISEFTVSALRGLRINGNPSDVVLARRFLTSSDYGVPEEALRVIESHGTVAETQELLLIASDKQSKMREAAAKVALKLSGGVDGAAKELINSGDPVLVTLAVESFGPLDAEQAEALIEPLLLSQEDKIRRAATDFFVRILEPEALEKLLITYLSNKTYYYDVVRRFDTQLYAPPNFRLPATTDG